MEVNSDINFILTVVVETTFFLSSDLNNINIILIAVVIDNNTLYEFVANINFLLNVVVKVTLLHVVV